MLCSAVMHQHGLQVCRPWPAARAAARENCGLAVQRRPGAKPLGGAQRGLCPQAAAFILLCSMSRLSSAAQPTVLAAPALLLMAVACGLCAGGNYYNQALLHSIALYFGVDDAAAGLSVTVAQVAYAVGLLLITPLGDKLERRRMAVVLMLLAALGHPLPLSTAVFIYAFAMLVGGLSFLPGGLGSSEAVMIALLALNGFPESAAVSATLICRLATLWFAVALGAVFLARQR